MLFQVPVLAGGGGESQASRAKSSLLLEVKGETAVCHKKHIPPPEGGKKSQEDELSRVARAHCAKGKLL